VRLDPLTQVANRLALGEAMQREWEQARLRGMPLALLMIDVDHFKAYNDHYGHVAGDRCLQRVAQALAGAVQRAGELAARYGGEEFAVLLPDSDELRAVAVAHRLREAVRELVLEHQASPCGALVTISVGVACVRPAGGQPLEHAQTTLFQQADEALYRAKQAGRDRVALYGADVQAAPPPDVG
jgi:diguanylate cyclase (GGDEF)-like protein